MAIKIGDNLNYAGSKPDFVRQQYTVKSDMLDVRDNAMPELYMAYCLEDRKIYLYDKSNTLDPVTGRFRIFESGGGGAQVTVMPEASEAFLDVIVQYVGEDTGEYVVGWFYRCVSETTTETVSVTTLEKLKELIEASSTTVTVKFEDDSTEGLKAYEFNGFSYYIFEDSVFEGVVVEGIITHSDSTLLSTDEDVVSRNITYDVSVTTYSWENITVSPSGSEPNVISTSEIDALFE